MADDNDSGDRNLGDIPGDISVDRKEYPAWYHEKSIRRGTMKRESGEIPLDTGQESKAVCGGRSHKCQQSGHEVNFPSLECFGKINSPGIFLLKESLFIN
jgi:hypothetical protein